MRERTPTEQDGALACVSDILSDGAAAFLDTPKPPLHQSMNSAPIRRGREVNMATGLYVRHDGSVMVALWA